MEFIFYKFERITNYGLLHDGYVYGYTHVRSDKEPDLIMEKYDNRNNMSLGIDVVEKMKYFYYYEKMLELRERLEFDEKLKLL